MSDKLSSVTSGAKEALKTTFKEVGNQVLGNEGPTKKQQEHTQKIRERAEAKGRTDEEQAKIEKLRKQLHQEAISPPAQEQERPQEQEEEDKVGTNETRQDFGNDPFQNQSGSNPPISSKKVERLKTRE